jgi:hypothetical protein
VTTADVSCRLLEVDYAGIENSLTAYYLWHHGVETAEGAYQYLRWCHLGLHAAVTAIKVGDPAFPNWPDDRIVAHLGMIKKKHATAYDICKRVDHGTGYGLTPFGMCEMFPDYFKSIKEAEEGQQFLFTLAPGLPKWHFAVRKRAREVGYLGGVTTHGTPTIWDHPYGYRHWFWDVLSYKPCDEVKARKWLRDPHKKDRIVQLHGRWFQVQFGGDSKRTCAYYPQSTGSAILKLAELRLFHPDSADYIGDAYFGRTPLLHPIHDALFMHLPNRVFDRVLAIVVRVMQDELKALPIPPEWNMGKFLRIGVAAKGGRTWDADDMHKLKVDAIRFGVEQPEDTPLIGRGESEAEGEMWDALSRRVA